MGSCGPMKVVSSFSVEAKQAFVRRRVGERFSPEGVVPRVKHGGGSLTVWGCMSGLGVGQLYQCEGTMRLERNTE